VHDTAARTSILLERLGDLSERLPFVRVDESKAEMPLDVLAQHLSPAYLDHLLTKASAFADADAGSADAPAAVFLDADETTIVCEGSLTWARRAAGCVAAAVRRAVQDAPGARTPRPQRAARVFAVCRPPGHHNSCSAALEEEWSQQDPGRETNFLFGCHGGCLLPNIAMAVRSLWAATTPPATDPTTPAAPPATADATPIVVPTTPLATAPAARAWP
jgi:acetoin utilization deacetylase AcuC-like enzyme